MNLLGLYPYPKLSKKFLGVEGREKREKESEIQRPATGAEPEFNDSTNRSSTLYPRERGNLKWREKERGRVGGERERALDILGSAVAKNFAPVRSPRFIEGHS